ncbi:MAG: glycosyltransferase family 4 protein [Pirellulales bacterium]
MPAAPITTRRILQAITPSHMSGAEMQIVRLIKRLQRRGHYVHTVVQRKTRAIAEFHARGEPVEPLPIGGKLNVAAIGVLSRAARRHRCELIHSSLSTASWWSGWLTRLGGLPSVGHVHGFTSASWHCHQSHLLAVSHAVKDDLVEQGIPGDRITVVHNALAPEEFEPQRDPLEVRAEFGADKATPVVAAFGHLSEKKGYRDLFRAIPLVLREVPQTQFWIVGSGKLRGELETYARQQGFLGQVRFTGYRRDAADLMNAIDVFALPSHREPCALVYAEAALAAKPIVACRSGGAPESISDGQTGLLVHVADSHAIAQAILTLLTNRESAQAMGLAGHDRALDLFSWNRYLASLEGIYSRVLDQSPALRRAA